MQNRVEFEYRMVRVKNAMSKLVDSLVVANTTDVFVDNIGCSHRWVVYAAQSLPIQQSELRSYNCSYVALENLTYVTKEDDEYFYICLAWPGMYTLLIEKLKQLSQNTSNVNRHPVVQG